MDFNLIRRSKGNDIGWIGCNDLVSIDIGKCEFCGSLPMTNGGPFCCRESWRVEQERLTDEAIKRLESLGYTVIPPAAHD